MTIELGYNTDFCEKSGKKQSSTPSPTGRGTNYLETQMNKTEEESATKWR